jgi:hypothetical protein
MFNCMCCHKSVGPHVSPMNLVIETREKVYPERHNSEGEVIDRGGSGREIAKEIKVCYPCFIEVTKK